MCEPSSRSLVGRRAAAGDQQVGSGTATDRRFTSWRWIDEEMWIFNYLPPKMRSEMLLGKSAAPPEEAEA